MKIIHLRHLRNRCVYCINAWLHPISPKVRKFEGSRVRRFFSPKVRKLEKKGSGVRTKRFCSPKVQNSEIMKYAIFFSNKYSFVT